MLEDTLLIILSDHGENFGDHGLASHQFCLYDSLLHVPLIMVYPDVIPKRRQISNLASLIDVFPTVLDIAKVEGFNDGIQGRSLFPFEDEKIHDFVFAESGETLRDPPPQFQPIRKKLEQVDKAAKCVRTETDKYILYQDGRQELYNIEKDPLERVNIASQNPDRAEHLKELVENGLDLSYFGPLRWKRQSKEVEERLRALGYF
jgi:arylsulfatase A-like enzyme